jgi:hypothetical protein
LFELNRKEKEKIELESIKTAKENELIANEKDKSISNSKIDIISAAKEALSEIKAIYGTGLGDQDVVLDTLDLNSNKLKDNELRMRGVTETIEEGDEEEEEREEAAELIQATTTEVMKTELEAEWDQVDNNRQQDKKDNKILKIMKKENEINIETSKEILPISSDTLVSITSTDLSYSQALSYLQSVDLSIYSSMIVTCNDSNKGWISSIMGSSKISYDGYNQGKNTFEYKYIIHKIIV